ncbi:TEX33 protein, partial [Thryothorus ludovicianus]|nr:TEX33 protein [Thryothorus ludovicianus]
SDYEQLSYNLNINLCQGGPLKSQSLMRDSYTLDTFQKSAIDPRHWHGKKITELGRWYGKYFLDLNVQKAMKEKYG